MMDKILIVTSVALALSILSMVIGFVWNKVLTDKKRAKKVAEISKQLKEGSHNNASVHLIDQSSVVESLAVYTKISTAPKVSFVMKSKEVPSKQVTADDSLQESKRFQYKLHYDKYKSKEGIAA